MGWRPGLQTGRLLPQQVCWGLLGADSDLEKDVGTRVRQNLTLILDVKS